jgi:hypothetical protein
MNSKCEYTVKGKRTVRIPMEIEKWLIAKARKKIASVPAEIKEILIEKYQAEKRAA